MLKVKKSSLHWTLAILLFLAAIFVVASAHVPLPAPISPLQWYSSESSDDLKQLIQKALADAKSSIYLSAFTLRDSSIMHLLQKKAKAGVDVRVLCDGRYATSTESFIEAKKLPGLFHRKILIIDDAKVYFGSANFTESGLIEQANHIAAIYSPPLAAFLKKGEGIYREKNLELYCLPSKEGLRRLINEIHRAKKSIDIALFSLTHPEILKALQSAEEHGVHVRAIIDSSSVKKAKSLSHLFTWKGGALMHHKFALFDGERIAFGSANWSKSAFEKNLDLIAFMPAPKKARGLFKKLLQKSLGIKRASALK